MKLFILKFLLYFFAGLLLLASVVTLKLYVRNNASFLVSESKTVIIAGDSHSASAISDRIFTRALNTSRGATPNMYSYAKVRKFIELNEQIDTVLWGFHFDSIKDIDSVWLFDSGNIIEKLPNHFTLLHHGRWHR